MIFLGSGDFIEKEVDSSYICKQHWLYLCPVNCMRVRAKNQYRLKKSHGIKYKKGLSKQCNLSHTGF